MEEEGEEEEEDLNDFLSLSDVRLLPTNNSSRHSFDR